jgi:hypothetical protein
LFFAVDKKQDGSDIDMIYDNVSLAACGHHLGDVGLN